MREQNGIFVYDADDQDFPKEIEGVHFSNIYFPYGIKVATVNDLKTWIPATKEDLIASESKRLGHVAKVQDIPYCGLVSPTSCYGRCQVGFCTRYYDPKTGHYYCGC